MQYRSLVNNKWTNGIIEHQKAEIDNEIYILFIKQLVSRTILRVNKPIVPKSVPAKNFHLHL